MKIQKIISQHRRDFTAEYICQYCEFTQTGPGYDDDHFHRNVIPDMVCPECGKKAGEDYEPRATKYAASETV